MFDFGDVCVGSHGRHLVLTAILMEVGSHSSLCFRSVLCVKVHVQYLSLNIPLDEIDPCISLTDTPYLRSVLCVLGCVDGNFC